MARKTSPSQPRTSVAQRLKHAAQKDKKLLADIRKGLEDERRSGLVRLKDHRSRPG